MAPPSRPSARDVIDTLGLAPHPEGGHFVETWRGEPGPDGRAIGTAILFLLAAGERSHWHRVDATEIWHFNAGDPIRLHVVVAGAEHTGGDPTERSIRSGHTTDDPTDQAAGTEHTIVLGPDVTAGQRPQATVPAGAWQSAEPLGAWGLVSCTVTPGFELDGFELAPPGWSPTSRPST